jgi:hypothetical protein
MTISNNKNPNQEIMMVRSLEAVGGNEEWCSCRGDQNGGSSKN